MKKLLILFLLLAPANAFGAQAAAAAAALPDKKECDTVYQSFVVAVSACQHAARDLNMLEIPDAHAKKLDAYQKQQQALHDLCYPTYEQVNNQQKAFVEEVYNAVGVFRDWKMGRKHLLALKI